MKKALLFIGLSFTLGSTAVAADESELRDGPCMKMLDACKAYIKKQPNKKSLYRDCMQPLLNDEKIEGVSINSEDLKACKSKKAELKQKK
jgi:hypothetical protein